MPNIIVTDIMIALFGVFTFIIYSYLIMSSIYEDND